MGLINENTMEFLAAAIAVQHARLRVGPNVWLKVPLASGRLLPTLMQFPCGDVYRRMHYSVERRAFRYQRDDTEKLRAATRQQMADVEAAKEREGLVVQVDHIPRSAPSFWDRVSSLF